MSHKPILLKKLNNLCIGGVLTNRLAIYYRDKLNEARFGDFAPKYAERIWVHPHDCHHALNDGIIRDYTGLAGRVASGLIVESPWPFEKSVPIMDVLKIRFCIDHWVDRVDWESTGAYEYIEKDIQIWGKWDGCENRKDIISRYNRLDKMFNQVKRDGRLLTREELYSGNFREEGGGRTHRA